MKSDKLKCLLCGKRYHHLGSHIWHGHHITAREYKAEFELPYKMALISDTVYQKKRVAFDENREMYLENLKEGGKSHRFKKGQSVARRISKYERELAIANIKKENAKHTKLEQCPVCKMKFNHMKSHLFNKHKMIQI